MPAKPILSDSEKDAIRNKLKELCEDSWIINGYKKTNIRGLCAEVQISIGTFYTLFGTKENLFFETIQDIHKKLADMFEEIMNVHPTKYGFTEAMKVLIREYAKKPLLYIPDSNSFSGTISQNDLEKMQLNSIHFFRKLIKDANLKLKVDEYKAYGVLSALLSTLNAKDNISLSYDYFSVYDFMVDNLMEYLFE